MKKKSIFAYIGLTTMVLGSLVSLPVSAEDTPGSIDGNVSTNNKIKNTSDKSNVPILAQVPDFNFDKSHFHFPTQFSESYTYVATAGSTHGIQVINGTNKGYKVTAKLNDMSNNDNGTKLSLKNVQFENNDNGGENNSIIKGYNPEILSSESTVASSDSSNKAVNGTLSTTNAKLNVSLSNLNGVVADADYTGTIEYKIYSTEHPTS